MPKYLVPFEGTLVVEATSWQGAEITALMWGQSLIRRKTGIGPITNTIDLSSSKDGVTGTSSPAVQAVNLTFGTAPFVDVTAEMEARREKAVEDDQHKRQQRGLSETDLTDEQLILREISRGSG